MTSPAPLTPPDPADEPAPAQQAAREARQVTLAPPPRYGRRGLVADLAQGLRYATATPLVMVTFGLDAVSEVFREASGLLARLSHRVEGGPR